MRMFNIKIILQIKTLMWLKVRTVFKLPIQIENKTQFL